MLGYAIAFLLGGYLIPASMHFTGIYKADRKSPDDPSIGESIMTAFMGAIFWPATDSRYEGEG